jgi:hypothetical protein
MYMVLMAPYVKTTSENDCDCIDGRMLNDGNDDGEGKTDKET